MLLGQTRTCLVRFRSGSVTHHSWGRGVLTSVHQQQTVVIANRSQQRASETSIRYDTIRYCCAGGNWREDGQQVNWRGLSAKESSGSKMDNTLKGSPPLLYWIWYSRCHWSIELAGTISLKDPSSLLIYKGTGSKQTAWSLTSVAAILIVFENVHYEGLLCVYNSICHNMNISFE